MNLLILAIFVAFPALLAGLLVLSLKPGKTLIRLLLGFSGAYLLTITLIHVLPEVYEHGGVKAGFWVLFGFAVQIVLDTFSRGVEHGHAHLSGTGPKKNRIFGLMVTGLCIHGFLEGLPLGKVQSVLDPLALGIMLHSIPVTAAFAGLLHMEQFKRPRALVFLLLFVSMVPMGLLTGFLFETSGFHAFHDVALALTVGIFLHISTTILFESGDHHQYHWQRILAILAGGALGLLSIGTPH